MDNASKFSCDVLYRPKSTKFSEEIRMYQGCPTLAVTKGGRIYLGWYSGGIREPHMDNYNLLIYSDDKGVTWSEPLIVIPSSYEMNIHALDIQLFTDNDGALHIMWVQNNTLPEPEIKPQEKPFQPLVYVDGYMFNDFRHAEWEIICNNPDAENPVFSEPRYVFPGFMRCKPTQLKNNDILYFNYDQINDKYAYSISADNGKSFSRHFGSTKIGTFFDEAMAYQLDDGSVRMFARCGNGELAESYSYDNGRTWTKARLSGITTADSRFYVRKLPSGRVLLINNDDKERTNMTIQLSEDDGRTWKYKKCIDSRKHLSYPDADFYDGRIYLSYDRERMGAMEILFASFTEQDIIDGKDIPVSVVSKPPVRPQKDEVIKAIEDEKVIAILRGVPKDKIIPVVQALYDGGIRLLEFTYTADEDVNDAENAENIRLVSERFGDRLYVGAGTVLTKEQVRLTKEAGGLFIISPNTDESVIRESYRCGLVSIPGALTPTEIAAAHSFGADYVKVFPVSVFGAKYIKDIKAPLSNVKLLAVGGIDENNVSEYLKAGACGFGFGSSIVNKALIDKEDYSTITERVKKLISAVKGDSCG